jgi:hypothetical protein
MPLTHSKEQFMKIALSVSAVALGISLACADQFAAAAPTVTISQSGTGNTVAAEQTGLDPDTDVSATITQNGTNNHVGGPGGTTGGILQYGPSSSAVAKVTQTGTGNNVGIVQGEVGILPPNIDITQTGNANSAIISQITSSGTDIIVKQNGTGNAPTSRKMRQIPRLM